MYLQHTFPGVPMRMLSRLKTAGGSLAGGKVHSLAESSFHAAQEGSTEFTHPSRQVLQRLRRHVQVLEDEPKTWSYSWP